MDTEQIKTKLQSKKFQKIIAILGIAIIILVLFSAGMEVGYIKAGFSYKFGDNYYRSFGPGGERHGMGMIPGGVSAAHGVTGKIISLNLPTLVVADRDNTEKVVHTENETVIRESRNTISSTDLKVGDFIIVIGEPNDTAEVDAKFIRVMPTPPPLVPAQIPVQN